MIFTGNIRNLIHLFITIVARTIFIKEFIQRRYNFFFYTDFTFQFGMYLLDALHAIIFYYENCV